MVYCRRLTSPFRLTAGHLTASEGMEARAGIEPTYEALQAPA